MKTVFGISTVVTINRFPTDTENELNLIERKCKELDVNVALSEVWGKGDRTLAEEVVRLSEEKNDFRQCAPRGFKVTVLNLKVSAGAGFIVALTGDILIMPGLPNVPSTEKIDVDSTGKISGLF